MGKTMFGFILGILIVPALGAAVEKKMAGLTNSITANDENLLKGMKLDREDCAKCHGDSGKPSHWGRNNFYPPAPQFADRGVDLEEQAVAGEAA